MKKTIHSVAAPATIGPYSQGIQTGHSVYVSGQLPINPSTGEFPKGIKDQTEQSLKNVQAILQEAGLQMSHVVKTTVFLTDMNDFSEVNEVYAEFFKENLPARSAVQVVALPKGARIEIEVIASVEV